MKGFFFILSLAFVSTAFSNNTDWVVNEKNDPYWRNLIANVGQYNEYTYLEKPEKFEYSWIHDEITPESLNQSLQELCVSTKKIEQTARDLLKNNEIVIMDVSLIGQNISEAELDYVLIKIKDNLGRTYYGLSEVLFAARDKSERALCLSAISPAR